ncbi:hypothetical protein N7523_010249 [Penicillium sp. IBT 18751x]|nr:hypothetical protein N7523_010249 [Penicillium sp. IBT 18751x]
MQKPSKLLEPYERKGDRSVKRAENLLLTADRYALDGMPKSSMMNFDEIRGEVKAAEGFRRIQDILGRLEQEDKPCLSECASCWALPAFVGVV